eukprot:TRINITY_DN9412_c0_g1_i1.p1 TRINITY_DN9412_c0_g1~~TRINITY_DN9412_c0_g1_i1.p1  ORF type:complete len:793 (+),score=129.93 TRINITY_DN9412_c0_g1_i1:103-2481(+)
MGARVLQRGFLALPVQNQMGAYCCAQSRNNEAGASGSQGPRAVPSEPAASRSYPNHASIKGEIHMTDGEKAAMLRRISKRTMKSATRRSVGQSALKRTLYDENGCPIPKSVRPRKKVHFETEYCSAEEAQSRQAEEFSRLRRKQMAEEADARRSERKRQVNDEKQKGKMERVISRATVSATSKKSHMNGGRNGTTISSEGSRLLDSQYASNEYGPEDLAYQNACKNARMTTGWADEEDDYEVHLEPVISARDSAYTPDEAARNIQSNFRGYAARREMRRMEWEREQELSAMSMHGGGGGLHMHGSLRGRDSWEAERLRSASPQPSVTWANSDEWEQGGGSASEPMAHMTTNEFRVLRKVAMQREAVVDVKAPSLLHPNSYSREQAATKIQSSWRGSIARQSVRQQDSKQVRYGGSSSSAREGGYAYHRQQLQQGHYAQHHHGPHTEHGHHPQQHAQHHLSSPPGHAQHHLSSPPGHAQHHLSSPPGHAQHHLSSQRDYAQHNHSSPPGHPQHHHSSQRNQHVEHPQHGSPPAHHAHYAQHAQHAQQLQQHGAYYAPSQNALWPPERTGEQGADRAHSDNPAARRRRADTDNTHHRPVKSEPQGKGGGGPTAMSVLRPVASPQQQRPAGGSPGSSRAASPAAGRSPQPHGKKPAPPPPREPSSPSGPSIRGRSPVSATSADENPKATAAPRAARPRPLTPSALGAKNSPQNTSHSEGSGNDTLRSPRQRQAPPPQSPRHPASPALQESRFMARRQEAAAVRSPSPANPSRKQHALAQGHGSSHHGPAGDVFQF